MMRLLRVELRRLFSRSLVVATMIGALVVSGLLLVGVWNDSQPMAEQELADAEASYQYDLEYWQDHGEEDVAMCLEDEAAESERLGEEVDYYCDEMGPPQREWYFYGANPLEDSLPSYLGSHASLLLLAALLVGATFTAAELSTGSMSNWLTFEPRRLRVYGSKVLAAALGIVPVTVLAIGLVVAGATAIGSYFGLADGMDSAAWADTAGMALRTVALVVLAALTGSALGFLLGHTAAVLGVAVVYLIGEQMLTSLVPAAQPWVLGININGWLGDGTVYFIEVCTTSAGGMMCDYTERALSFGHSAAYLLVGTAVVVTLAALVFRRRDAA